jgi:hypothetical protein
VFQVRAHAVGPEERHYFAFVVCLALAGALVLTAVDGPLLDRPAAVFPEEWAILAVHLLAVASFTSRMTVLVGRWAILPTWLFFIVVGNTSSGGAVSPALLPLPFAFLSRWLPSGATVSALRDAIYFRNYQHVLPLAVLALWGSDCSRCGFSSSAVARQPHDRRTPPCGLTSHQTPAFAASLALSGLAVVGLAPNPAANERVGVVREDPASPRHVERRKGRLLNLQPTVLDHPERLLRDGR